MKQSNDQQKSIFGGVFTGYIILILHLLLIIALAATVVFLKSLYDIRWFLLAAGLALLAASGYYFFQRIRKNNRKLMDLVNDPTLQGRSLEISLLGGMATFKLGNEKEGSSSTLLIDDQGNEIKQLEMSHPSQLASLAELKALLDEELITKEEFLKLKKEIIGSERVG